MPTVTINLNDQTTYPRKVTHKTAKVWTKPNWAASWTERPDLVPTECVWTHGHSESAATLHYRYGSVMLPGESSHSTLTKITTRGYFVLIAWGTDDGNPMYWLGYAESAITANHHPAADNLPESGIQTVPCFSLSRALAQSYITTTVHEDPAGGATPNRSGGGSVFNPHSKGNRNDTKRRIEDGDEAYVFTNPTDDGEFWSSRQIVEHLVAFHMPTPTSVKETGGIPWVIESPSIIPDWDRPEIDTDGKSILAIIKEILTPTRALDFSVSADATFNGVNLPPTINALSIKPFTHLAADLALPSFGDVPANPDIVNILENTDPQTSATVTEDESDVVDQIIVRGPREIGIATFNYRDAGQGELERDWDLGDESDYSAEPATASGWAAMKPYEKREVNDLVRGKAKYSDIFRAFRIHKEWDGTSEGEEVFLQEGDDPYVPYLASVEWLDKLPLYKGIDYSGDPAAVNELPGKVRMDPIYLIANPETGNFDPFHKVGPQESGFNATVPGIVPFTLRGSTDTQRGPRVLVDVSGGPRHAIAGTTFAANDGDIDHKSYGGYDYKTIKATLAMRGDRRPQHAKPSSVNADVVRRKIVTIEHPTLEIVHIANRTIVDFNPDSTTIESTGGILRDPSDQLEAIATMLAEHHLTPRKRAVITTGRRLSQVRVGKLLNRVSDYLGIQIPIIEIKITSPINRNDNIDNPTMEIIAASQRSDVMSLLAPIEEDQEPTEE